MISLLLKARGLLSKASPSQYLIILVLGLAVTIYYQKNKIVKYKEAVVILKERITALEETQSVLNANLIQSNEFISKDSERLVRIRQEATELRTVIVNLRLNSRQAIKDIMNSTTPESAEASIQLLRESLDYLEFNKQ